MEFYIYVFFPFNLKELNIQLTWKITDSKYLAFKYQR